MGDYTATRAYIYVAGNIIDPAQNNFNENTIYTQHNAAFHATTGHKHTGATGDAPVLTLASIPTITNIMKQIVPIGSVIPFDDFDGDLTFDTDYWKYCDGSTYDFGGTIGVKTIPDLSGRYIVGFGTDGGGDIDSASWSGSPVGNASHQINTQHDHSYSRDFSVSIDHTHSNSFSVSLSGLSVSISADGGHDHGGYTHDLSTTAWAESNTPANYRIKDDSAGWKSHPDYWIGVDDNAPDTGTQGHHDHNIASVANHSHSGSTVSGSVSLSGSVSSTSGLVAAQSSTSYTTGTFSTTQSIQPRSIPLRFIMRVA